VVLAFHIFASSAWHLFLEAPTTRMPSCTGTPMPWATHFPFSILAMVYLVKPRRMREASLHPQALQAILSLNRAMSLRGRQIDRHRRPCSPPDRLDHLIKRSVRGLAERDVLLSVAELFLDVTGFGGDVISAGNVITFAGYSVPIVFVRVVVLDDLSSLR